MVAVIVAAVCVTAAEPVGVRLTQAAASRPLADRLETTIVIPVGGAASGFSPQTVSASSTAALLKLVNKDTMTHSVTSVAVDKKGTRSSTWSSRPTTGTLVVPATLAAGKYPFYCSFHPNMQGTLVVTGEGGDAPEPPEFEQALRIPEVLTGSKITSR